MNDRDDAARRGGDANNPHRKSEQLYPTLFGTVAAALSIIVIITASLRLADALRPQTGDMISFVASPSGVVTAQASLTVERAGQSPVAFCMLQPGVMRQSGGSLVVEAVVNAATRRYRVHWAGGRTSDTGADCGRTADLLLTPGDIGVLLFAASAPAETTAEPYSRPGMGRRAR
ncbi:MAG TPA: hypothetical protein VMB34_09335 [Acetobacteraceae bacterium]|nr:hypothetical protein [Acetobacteraceae bacterium]